MEVTPEMINAFIADQMPLMSKNDRVLVFQGIAIYTYLQSPASEEWRREHEFETIKQ